MTDGGYHVPVMLREVIEFLRPKPGDVFVDATLGGGGHAAAILERISPGGILLGIDRDADAIAEAKRKFHSDKNVHLMQSRMSEIERCVLSQGLKCVDGVLADLGVSSHHLDMAERGFSFKADAPLDMRMDRGSGESAADLLSRLKREDVERILKEFGEERYARRIADSITSHGRIETTGELSDLIEKSVPHHARRSKIHPATRTFQALRIVVNDEIDELKNFLSSAPSLLKPGGRMAVIGYHSLEDRLVKRTFRTLSAEGDFNLPRRKAVKPDGREIRKNPRSRSARLRVLERNPVR